MKLGLRPATFLTGISLSGFLVAALAAQGCTVEVTNSPSDGGSIFDCNRDSGSDAADSGKPSATDACSRCLYGRCSALHATCDNNKDCTAIYNCAVQPGANATTCFQQHVNGQSTYLALATCDEGQSCTTCSVECEGNPIKPPPATCQKYAPATPPDAGTPQDSGTPPADSGTVAVDRCPTCVGSKCATQQAACAEGSECQSYSNCVRTCAAGAPGQLEACVEACGTVYPTGKTKGEELATCTNTSCKEECF